MRWSHNSVYYIGIFLIGYGVCQHLIEDRHLAHSTQHQLPHLQEIPKVFEVTGNENALREFKKYVSDIAELARKDNSTVMYKVKVEIVKPYHKWLAKKLAKSKKTRTKKFNVPLKRNSMKLSHFEKIMRKIADENHQKPEFEEISTTSVIPHKIITKQPHSGKYKPVIGVLRNYSKRIKPVKNDIITIRR